METTDYQSNIRKIQVIFHKSMDLLTSSILNNNNSNNNNNDNNKITVRIVSQTIRERTCIRSLVELIF
jgi:hypothetical protein